MQEGADYLLLVEAVPRGEGDRVYAAQRAIRRLGDKPLDGRHGLAVDGLTQHGEQRLGFVRQGRGHEARSGQ